MTDPSSLSDSADFFISYTGNDVKWAEWIAWQLENAGYSVVIQAWDFRPGNNFVVEMDRATASSQRTLLVLSQSAVASDFVKSEWAAAFSRDPSGLQRKLVPVRVEDVDVSGLLGPVVYVDLVGKDGEASARALLAGVEPGRSKPTSAPDFPGATAPPVQVPRTRSTALQWAAVDDAMSPVRLRDLDSAANRGYQVVLEFHLLPLQSVLVPASALAALENKLAAAGRDGGLFSSTAALEVQGRSDFTSVRLAERADNDTGLLVTRSGQVGGWFSLPRDSLGSVLDSSEASVRLAALIRILTRLGVPTPRRYAPSASLGPLTMLTVGDASIVGRRNSSSMRTFGPSEIDTPVEDSIPADALPASAEELAAEMLARLLPRLR